MWHVAYPSSISVWQRCVSLFLVAVWQLRCFRLWLLGCLIDRSQVGWKRGAAMFGLRGMAVFSSFVVGVCVCVCVCGLCLRVAVFYIIGCLFVLFWWGCVFLQNIEQKHLPSIAKKHNLTYFRYVDDILIVYDTQQTDIASLLADFNSLHPKLQFTKETEHNNQINYLDITIHRQQTKCQNINLQETYIYGYYHPIHLQPSDTTQICCCQIST